MDKNSKNSLNEIQIRKLIREEIKHQQDFKQLSEDIVEGVEKIKKMLKNKGYV